MNVECSHQCFHLMEFPWPVLTPGSFFSTVFLRSVSGISFSNQPLSIDIIIDNIDIRAGKFLKMEKLCFREGKEFQEKLMSSSVTTGAVLTYQ